MPRAWGRKCVGRLKMITGTVSRHAEPEYQIKKNFGVPGPLNNPVKPMDAREKTIVAMEKHKVPHGCYDKPHCC